MYPILDTVGDLWESANPRTARAIAMARQVAASDVPVLLVGESGTGKRTLASAIHGWSPRRANPFVIVWCDALREHQLESGLIEHLHGAVTGFPSCRDSGLRSLNGVTLFFDGLGGRHLPATLQVALVGELEGRRGTDFGGTHSAEPGVRIIAASHHDLEADVREGRLRKDLLSHLSVVVIALPPLRERREDFPLLRDRFLARLAARHRRSPIRLTPEAERLLARHHWPGNLRELTNVLERAVVLSFGDRVDADEIAPSLTTATPIEPPASLSLVETEQRQIRLALQDSATLAEAAGRLGIDPATLWRKRKRYGLSGPPITFHRAARQRG
jgi:NtrC-family two-component system response regulator AlgB